MLGLDGMGVVAIFRLFYILSIVCAIGWVVPTAYMTWAYITGTPSKVHRIGSITSLFVYLLIVIYRLSGYVIYGF